MATTVAEIDKQIAALQEQRRIVEEKEEHARRLAEFTEANEKLDLLRETLTWLEKHGYLPVKLRPVLTNSEGTFTPGLFIRKLRKVPGASDPTDIGHP